MLFRKNIFVVSAIYFLAAVLLFPYLKYYIDNPDTFSYISISEKYANGNFSEAVNGYWSPLICWLLAIPLKFNADSIVAMKILQLLIGWFALTQWLLLSGKFLENKFFKVLITIAAIPFLLSWSLLNFAPDLLFLSTVLLYINIVCRESFFNKQIFGVQAGIIGAILYFSKSFGFLFFLVHFSIVVFYQILKQRDAIFRERILKNYAVSLICFLFLTGGWIFLLSKKYHHFTISETVVFNLSKEVLPATEQKNQLFVPKGGLYSLSNSTALNAWEDPGINFKYTPLKPFSSSSDFQIYKKVLKRNFLTIYYFDFRRQIGTLFLMIILLFAAFSNKRKLLITFPIFPILLTIALFYGMYGLILVYTRYVWICTLLMILLIVCLSEKWLQQKPSSSKNLLVKTSVILMLLFAIKRPIKEIFFSDDTDSSIRQLGSAMVNPFDQLRQTYRVDHELFDATDSLSKIIKRGERIASVKEKKHERDNYTRSTLVAYKCGDKYFGQIPIDEQMSGQMEDSLNRFQINYLLLWNNDSLSANGPANQKRIYVNKKIPLQIIERHIILKP